MITCRSVEKFFSEYHSSWKRALSSAAAAGKDLSIVFSVASFSSLGRSLVSFVGTKPGATALTVMLRVATSRARALVKPRMPALAAE